MKDRTVILFDFDGTVMDTNRLVINSWQHTFRTLEGKERPEAEILPTLGEPLNLTVAKVLPAFEPDRVVETYRSYHLNHFSGQIDLFPGIRELLARLKETRRRIGMVTSRQARSTLEGLRQFDILKYFDTVVTWEDTDRHKPDPEPIRIALRRLAASESDALMIGDSRFDILCARNAGVPSVLVTWAADSDSSAAGLGPDYTVGRPGELLAILGETF